MFNALVDAGDAVTLQAFDTQDEAKAAHRLGLRRMFMLALKEQVKYLEKNLPGLQAMAMQFLPFGSQQDLQRQILAVTFDRCCLNDPWPETEKEFATRCKDAKARLNLVAQEIARLVGAVLTDYQALQKALPGFKAQGQVQQDIRGQCEWLLGKEWVARTPYERMQHLPRYLKAINVRLEKLRANPARDAQNMAQMNPLLQQWQRRLSAQQGESGCAAGGLRLDAAGIARVAVRAGTEDAGDRLRQAAGEDAGGTKLKWMLVESGWLNHDAEEGGCVAGRRGRNERDAGEAAGAA